MVGHTVSMANTILATLDKIISKLNIYHAGRKGGSETGLRAWGGFQLGPPTGQELGVRQVARQL